MTKTAIRAAFAILVGGAAAHAQIVLDPFVDPLAQGYETDGTGDYHTGARLVINDTSSQGHRTFFKTLPDIATSNVAVDVSVSVALSGLTPNGIDTGVRAILSEGAGGVELAVALIERPGGDRRVAFLLAPNSFSQGLVFDWTVEQTFRIERNSDPSRRAVLTVSGQPSEVLTDGDLPPGRRANPNFEFGAAVDTATAIALFGPIAPPPIRGRTCQVTTNFAPQLDPSISGDIVAFTDQRNGNDDVYFIDLATGAEKQVTTSRAPQRLHDVSGSRIAYTDLTPPKARISVFDVSTLTASPVSPGSDQNARIDGQIVAFERGVATNTDVIVVDLANGNETPVAATAAVEESPSVSGTRVVYERHATLGVPGDIVLFDLATGAETMVADTPADERRPDIDGDIVVYDVVSPSGDVDVAIHDISTGSTHILRRPGNQRLAHVSGRFVSFDDDGAGNPDVTLYHIDSGATVAVATNAAADFLNDISGHRVVYTSNVSGNLDIWMFEFTIADIEVNPTAHDFKGVEVGTQATVTVAVGNAGDGDLTVTGVSFASKSGAAFSIASMEKAGAAVSTPVVVAPGEKLDVEVAFEPASAGPAVDALLIASNDPDETFLKVPLNGKGVVSGGPQVPGDCNQDGVVDISDAICLLDFLFQGTRTKLACGDGGVSHPANLQLMNWNNDPQIDLSDAIGLLNWAFSGGRGHFLGADCKPFADCPPVCKP